MVWARASGRTAGTTIIDLTPNQQCSTMVLVKAYGGATSRAAAMHYIGEDAPTPRNFQAKGGQGKGDGTTEVKTVMLRITAVKCFAPGVLMHQLM